jgi:hypothetical protein
LIARLSASVPPEVKITSAGLAPTSVAMSSRESSTTRRAARPEACSDDGLPVTPSWAVTASIAATTVGVVAA